MAAVTGWFIRRPWRSRWNAHDRAAELLPHRTGAVNIWVPTEVWGRLDMAAWLFTRAILAGEPIKVFNQGRMMRDLTYIDDAIAGTSAAHDRPPADDRGPHVLYNLANHHPENLLDFIATLERLLGRTATEVPLPLQPGDAPETFADIETARRDLGFEPKTGIADGLACFVAWYKARHRLD